MRARYLIQNSQIDPHFCPSRLFTPVGQRSAFHEWQTSRVLHRLPRRVRPTVLILFFKHMHAWASVYYSCNSGIWGSFINSCRHFNGTTGPGLHVDVHVNYVQTTAWPVYRVSHSSFSQIFFPTLSLFIACCCPLHPRFLVTYPVH